VAKNYKTIKVRTVTQDNDWNRFIKQTHKFVDKGLKVRFHMQIKGRQKSLIDYDHETDRFKARLKDFKITNVFSNKFGDILIEVVKK
jgi:translation initiation factor IF-3